jgi:hypothetical protein
MPSGALFIGWGAVIVGREQQSFAVFNEGIQYFAQLQQRGEIDSFEPVALEPHGGDLYGFILLRGDRERLNRLRYSEEFIRQINRAGVVVHGIGVVGAYTGEELNRLFMSFQEHIADLTGPAR